MGKIYEFNGIKPVISKKAWLHDSAVVIGDVVIEDDCYIGPYAVLRGDYTRLTVGKGSNVQDHCMLHSYPEYPVMLEPDCHIGHGVILHGCILRENCMVGMNAVVMDGAVVGKNSMVGAMAFVKSGMQIPDNMMVFGSPARIIRELTEQELKEKTFGTNCYKMLAQEGLNGAMKPCEPLRELDENRPQLDWLKRVKKP